MRKIIPLFLLLLFAVFLSGCVQKPSKPARIGGLPTYAYRYTFATNLDSNITKFLFFSKDGIDYFYNKTTWQGEKYNVLFAFYDGKYFARIGDENTTFITNGFSGFSLFSKLFFFRTLKGLKNYLKNNGFEIKDINASCYSFSGKYFDYISNFFTKEDLNLLNIKNLIKDKNALLEGIACEEGGIVKSIDFNFPSFMNGKKTKFVGKISLVGKERIKPDKFLKEKVVLLFDLSRFKEYLLVLKEGKHKVRIKYFDKNEEEKEIEGRRFELIDLNVDFNAFSKEKKGVVYVCDDANNCTYLTNKILGGFLLVELLFRSANAFLGAMKNANNMPYSEKIKLVNYSHEVGKDGNVQTLKFSIGKTLDEILIVIYPTKTVLSTNYFYMNKKENIDLLKVDSSNSKYMKLKYYINRSAINNMLLFGTLLFKNYWTSKEHLRKKGFKIRDINLSCFSFSGNALELLKDFNLYETFSKDKNKDVNYENSFNGTICLAEASLEGKWIREMDYNLFGQQGRIYKTGEEMFDLSKLFEETVGLYLEGENPFMPEKKLIILKPGKHKIKLYYLDGKEKEIEIEGNAFEIKELEDLNNVKKVCDEYNKCTYIAR